MPPKKASTKANGKTKASSQTPSQNCTPKPKPASKKRKAIPEVDKPPTPEWDKNVRSTAKRERSRFKLSMSSLQDPISEAELAKMAESLTGSSRNTWGLSSSSPIPGSRRPAKRARPNSILRGFQAGDNFKEAEAAYAMLMEDVKSKRKVGSNSPSKSRLLRMSLEVREIIWGYLLVYPKPIMVKADWTTSERNPFVSHAIMLVCKQFAVECTNFLFKRNVVVSLLRQPSQARRYYEEPVSIPSSALSIYRNIVLDCAPDCWNTDWFEKATDGLKKLVNARANIESLTLRFMPKKVGVSSTARGMKSNPITFADFLCYDGEFMKTLCALAPKKLTVIVKKGAGVKLAFEVDMRDIRRIREAEEAGDIERIVEIDNTSDIEVLYATNNAKRIKPLEDIKISLSRDIGYRKTQESMQLLRKKADAVIFKSKGLERLYKEIFMDHGKALSEGKCKMLEETVVSFKGLSLSMPAKPDRNQCHTLASSNNDAHDLSLIQAYNNLIAPDTEIATTTDDQPATKDTKDDDT